MDWLTLGTTITTVCFIPLVGVLTAYAIFLIKMQKNELAEAVTNEDAKKYLDMIESTIIECVIATNQTYVDSLKGQNAFDSDAQKQAFNKTYETVLDILTEETKEYLATITSDVNKYLTTKIEATVATCKDM